AVKDVNWSPDGSMLVLVNTQDSVQVWDSAKWEIMYSYEALDLSLNEISWSPDGVTLAVGGFPAEAFIFSAENREDLNMENNNVVGFAGGEASRLGHIEDLVWSPNSKQMAIIDCLHRFRVWDAAMGKILLVPQNTKICAADWSPDGTRLYTAGEFGLQVWDTRNWELIHDSRGHTSHIFSIAWSPDGKMIASGNGVVQLWDVYSGELARQYEGHTVGIANLVWSPDSLRVASIGMDGLARIWDAITLEDLLVYDGHLTNREDYGSHGRITWSPDGGTLATLMFDPTLQIWNSTNGNLIHLIDDKEKYGSFNSVAWSPKGDYIAVTSNHNQNIYLIESNSGKVIKNLDSHNYLVSSVSWSHDGLQFVSAGRYGFIWLWNAITWKLKAYFDCGQIINSVALSPNGRLLAAACNYEIWVWDVASGELQDILDTHTYIVSSLTWSPDGTKFASGSHDGIVYIWDVQIKR
ncbi:MAG: WD40 repeat domain-containing protein, partial [Anaerolineae bacterium]|nr:WD40 repeat domain-containing protein [Anaerolineae bacterium]